MGVKTEGDVWTPDSMGSSSSPSSGSTGAGSVGVISSNPLYPGSDLWNQKVWTVGTDLEHHGGMPIAGPAEMNMTYGQLMTMVGKYDPQEMRYFQRQMVRADLVSPTSITSGGADESTMTAFAEIFAATIRYNQQKPPAQRMTWQEVLASMAKGKGKGGGSSSGPQTYTQSYTSKTGLGASERYLESAMTRLLGRAPTDQEIAAFKGDLNAKEAADPTVRTTTSDGHGHTSSTTQQSDVDPYAEAKDYATSGSRSTEAGAYGIQQYASALEQLFGGG